MSAGNGIENIKEGVLKLIKSEINRIAKTVTQEGEWSEDDQSIVLKVLATNGLRPQETLEEVILRGILARVEVNTVARMYVADKQGRVQSVQGKGDVSEQAKQSRAA